MALVEVTCSLFQGLCKTSLVHSCICNRMKAILLSLSFAVASLLLSYTALSELVGWTLKGFLELLILPPYKSCIYDSG